MILLTTSVHQSINFRAINVLSMQFILASKNCSQLLLCTFESKQKQMLLDDTFKSLQRKRADGKTINACTERKKWPLTLYGFCWVEERSVISCQLFCFNEVGDEPRKAPRTKLKMNSTGSSSSFRRELNSDANYFYGVHPSTVVYPKLKLHVSLIKFNSFTCL